MQIDNKMLAGFEERYRENPSNAVIAGAIQTVGIDEASMRQEVVRRHDFIFSDKTELGKPTAQKSSGRCWMFAALNVIRPAVMKTLNVESFEFSETYLFFYDKLEKANSFLERVIETREEDLMEREVYDLVSSATFDGGYFEWFRSLAKKYGLVPKSVMPETFHSENTYMYTKQMDLRLIRAAKDIRKAAAEKAAMEEIRAIQKDALYDVYNISVKALGHPVEEFDLTYYDKDKTFHREAGMTPKAFYEKYVGDEALSHVILVEDPREKFPKSRWLQCSKLKSVWEGEPVKAYNVSLEELKKSTIRSIKAGEPVWFACDVGKDISRKKGLLDTELFNYDETLTPMGEMSKADRLDYRIAAMTHAMVFTGVDLDAEGKPVRWMVENSWGKDLGDNGVFSMSDAWFDLHNYSVVVKKEYLSEEYHKGLSEEPIEIKYFDPVVELMSGMEK